MCEWSKAQPLSIVIEYRTFQLCSTNHSMSNCSIQLFIENTPKLGQEQLFLTTIGSV